MTENAATADRLAPDERDAVAIATLMVCRLAREVRDGDVVGVGLGTPLALCAALLARATHAPGAEILVGGAVSPDADLLTCLRGATALEGSTVGFVPHLDTMEMAERGAMTLQFLRPAQVDGDGNANVSRIVRDGELVARLPGGLATADVLRILPRVVLYHTDHRPRSLPQRLPFVTGAHGGVESGAGGPALLVTDRAVLSFSPDAVLESVHPGEQLDDILDETGFTPRVGVVGPTDGPSRDELAALESIDPHRLRELELRETRGAAARRLRALCSTTKEEKMAEMRLDHVAMLVHDLDASVEKWREMLEILDPEQAGEVVYGEGEENGERMRWATFVKPGGTAIQLFTPAGEGGFLNKILAKRGEVVHHIAFLSSDVDATVQQLRDKGIPIVQEEQTAPDTYPWLRWNFVPPDYASGALVEVAQRYRIADGAWAPVEGDPQR